LFAEQTARFHDLDALRREMLTRVNAARAEHGLPPLKSDPALDRAAQAYADEVFQALSAGRPLPPRGELAKRVEEQGYRILSGVGEDVVEGALSPEATLAALLGRGDHRAQVLRKNFSDLGLGLAFERRGDGYFVVWVQCLARGGVTPEIALPPDIGRDPRLAWLRRNAIAVRTIDPADEDYRDLEPLRAVFATARIVMLGEASHGDGAGFRAKSRLARFLHREMGFSVLAFESGLFDCAKAQELIAGGEDSGRAASRAVFGIWSGSAEARPLLADLGPFAKSGAPLELAGFDSQFTGSASVDFLATDLERYLRSIGAEAVGGKNWES